MKNIFLKLIKDAGCELVSYKYSKLDYSCQGWEIEVKDPSDDIRGAWDGSYFNEQAGSKEWMIEDFKKFLTRN